MPPLTGFNNKGFSMAQADPRQAMSDQMNVQNKKKPWWTSLISEAGGAGGALGGAELGATVGSVVPGIGTAIGGLAGAALGGFLGGTAGRVAENEVRDNRVGLGDALKEGAVSGVLSAGPGQLLKVARGGEAALAGGGAKAFAAATAGTSPEDLLKTSARGKLFQAGNKALASQYGTISKPVARQTNPLDTISKLADYGVTRPQDAERIAQQFTGAEGITNQAVVNAVGKSSKVDLSGLESAVDDALAKNGVVGSHAKSVKSFVMGQLGRAADSTTVDPTLALDIMRNVEKQGSEVLGKGGTYHLATTENSLQAKALNDIKGSLGDALYETAGANKNVAGVLTPEFRQQLIDLQPKSQKWQQFIDNQVMKSKSIADLRSTMAPFVRISKIIDEGDTNALTFGGRVGNAFTGGGSVPNALLTMGANAVKNPAARVSGSALRATSTAGLGAVAAPTAKGIITRAALTGANPTALLQAGGATVAAQTNPNSLLTSGTPPVVSHSPNSLLASAPSSPDATSTLLGKPGGATDATASLLGQPQSPSTASGPSLASLQQAIQQDIATTGGKNINNLMQLGQLYGIVDNTGSPVGQSKSGLPAGVGKVSAQEYANAAAGAQSVQQISQMLQSDPNLLNKNAIPGGGLPIVGGFVKNASGSNTAQLDAIAYNAADKYLKLTTGATATEGEIKNTANKLMPRAGDSPQTVQTKLRSLQDYYNLYLQGAQ